jgi:hypothetical protein
MWQTAQRLVWEMSDIIWTKIRLYWQIIVVTTVTIWGKLSVNETVETPVSCLSVHYLELKSDRMANKLFHTESPARYKHFFRPEYHGRDLSSRNAHLAHRNWYRVSFTYKHAMQVKLEYCYIGKDNCRWRYWYPLICHKDESLTSMFAPNLNISTYEAGVGHSKV